jgi:uncharacterized protein YwqG
MKSIPPFQLIPKALSEEARKMPRFKWAEAIIGTRHKLGGEPDFIQKTTVPHCKECNKEMVFYAQLDSINDEFCIGDCGMIYVFICFECLSSVSIIQSY